MVCSPKELELIISKFLQMITDNLKILDCTFRDGGYYNNWNFSNSLTRKYLTGISNSGIKFCEIGFRSLPQQSFYGPYYYSTDDFIQTLDLPKNLQYML